MILAEIIVFPLENQVFWGHTIKPYPGGAVGRQRIELGNDERPRQPKIIEIPKEFA